MLDNEYSDFEQEKHISYENHLEEKKQWDDMLRNGNVHKTHQFIPQEPRALDQWICADVADDGCCIKTQPVCAKTGLRASWNDPSTWCSFTEASQAVKDGRHHHIAFVRQPDDEFTFIEISGGMSCDCCVPQAYLEVDYLARGYTSFFRTGEVQFTPPEKPVGTIVYEIYRDWYVVMTGREVEPQIPGYIEAGSDTGNSFQDDWAHSC